ncbi:hypothetical protein SAMN04489722_102271 [Algibacter lectus]|uniref:hypothetical protein n=1 Tax=Algibacter lectus TaxID=221126 RepID=UPI0008E0B783|nr:hypothetical protein [Algibacter lectus]SFC35487.1 hypothetical protein SAMN04489722_102271 [Algibacter lectus]
MKKFVINICLFLFGIIFFITLGICLPNLATTKSNDYSIIEKHQLLKKIESPRLILVGDSNVAFGFNSQLFADSLNINPINTAIHAGYGLKYILDDTYDFIKKGDIIIVSPAYSQFYGNTFLGREPLLYSLKALPSNVPLLSLKQGYNLLQYIPKYSIQNYKGFSKSILMEEKKLSKNDNNFVYSRKSINKYGDMVSHWGLAKIDFEPYVIKKTDKFNEESFKYLKDYITKVNSKGAQVFFSYPSLMKTSYVLNKEKIEYLEKLLEQNNISTIGSPTSYFYGDNYYFNSPYHLGFQGANKRTLLHVEFLKHYLNHD